MKDQMREMSLSISKAQKQPQEDRKRIYQDLVSEMIITQSRHICKLTNYTEQRR